jgi:hypothetical protein
VLGASFCQIGGPFHVAVTFTTDHGTFRSWVLDDHVKEFRVGDGKSQIVHTQRTAQVADWTFHLDSAKLTLKDSNDKDYLSVEATDPNAPIAIVAGTAEEKDLFEVLDKGESSHALDVDDHHFDVYYDRCQHPAQRAIPYKGDACKANWPTQEVSYWPIWMTREWKRIVNGGGVAAIAGGFNCGPDQFP